jgi:hypothetical protein
MGLSKGPMSSNDISERVTGRQMDHLQLLPNDEHVIAAYIKRKLVALVSLVKIARRGRCYALILLLRMPYCQKTT